MKEALLDLSEWLVLIVGVGFFLVYLWDSIFPGDDRPDWERRLENEWKLKSQAERRKRFYLPK
jgi:hypothetical protein